MKRLTFIQSLASVALALGAMVAAPTAQAANSVYFSIGVQQPERHGQAMPPYVQPRSTYRPAPVEYGRFDHHRNFRGHPVQAHRFYKDSDRDGIPNRYDQDRDGDGVRNRYDRQPNNPYRR